MRRITGGQQRLVDLAEPDGTVRDLDAVNVRFLGPAVVLPFRSTTFVDCDWNAGVGSVESLLWPVDPDRGGVVLGAVALQGCTFRRCDFLNIGYAGTPDALALFSRRLRPD
jgi:hypothetical protein